MSTSRRDFLRNTSAVGAAAIFGSSARRVLAAPVGTEKAASPLKILILGGTGFLGPHVVEYAERRGHSLTLFNRGKTNPQLFPNVEKLRGDRNGDLKALEGRKWDAIVDTSGYVPRHVRDSAALLKDAVRQYVFISTISVFAGFSKPGMDESAPVGKLDDESIEKIDGETYGPLKALCEQAAEKAMPGRVTTIRPGLIVGPGDPTDRFTYWPVRVARGGEVLAPGSPDDPVQFIDARDLAEWIVHTLERRITGVFNATGPADSFTIGRLLETCVSASGSEAKLVWADAEFLASHKVAPWSDMPVWVPGTGESAGMSRINCSKAIGRGLSFRPVAVTVRDTLAWFKTLPAERQEKLRAGISAERERDVIGAIKKRQRGATVK